jgi:hypothetical protein
MITLKIDVDKINKKHLFQGKQGRYLDVVLFESKDKKYGNDFMVVQGISQEARKAGERGPILGNGKIVQTRNDPQPKQEGNGMYEQERYEPSNEPKKEAPKQSQEEADSEIPF